MAWCLNDLDENGDPLDLYIRGDNEAVPHRRIDINFRPCIPQNDDVSLDCYHTSRDFL